MAGEDVVSRIQGGWLEFDAVIATPDVMKAVGRLGKILGPRGLMPTAKTNTVTFDVADAVKEIKAGRVEFRVDKTAIVHNSVGKASFDNQKLFENPDAGDPQGEARRRQGAVREERDFEHHHGRGHQDRSQRRPEGVRGVAFLASIPAFFGTLAQKLFFCYNRRR